MPADLRRISITDPRDRKALAEAAALLSIVRRSIGDAAHGAVEPGAARAIGSGEPVHTSSPASVYEGLKAYRLGKKEVAQLREEAAVTEEIDAQLAAYERALAKHFTDKRARSAGRKRSIESVESAALAAESFFQTLRARVRTCLFDQPDAIGPLLGLLPRLPERRTAAKPASGVQASAS